MSDADSVQQWMGDAAGTGGIAAEAMLAGLRRGMFGVREANASIDRYVDLEPIGRGGMGVVYRAWDPQLRRPVAVKLLHARTRLDQARLRREARAMARLSHPNVVDVLAVGEHHGECYVVMQLVRGSDAAAWLAQAPRSFDEILAVFVAAGRGLAAAHAAGLVHRDFKPSNVLVAEDGQVRVTDFGLSAAIGPHADGSKAALSYADPVAPLDSDSQQLTATGARLGTPRYMAPEQRQGCAIDHRADQYAFAVSVYEALTGLHPRTGTRRRGARRLPPRLRRALERAMAVDPNHRFASVEDLLSQLRRRRGAPASWIAVGAAVTVAATWLTAEHFRAASTTCDPEAASARVWDADRSERVYQAMTTTNAPHAEEAARRVTSAIDAWHARWRATYVDACRLGSEPRDRPTDSAAVMQCMDRDLTEIGALTDLFEHATPELIPRAGGAIVDLPVTSRCLNERAGEAARLDPEALAAFEGTLARARAAVRAGRFDTGAQHAERALAMAATLGVPSLRRRALLSLGENLRRAGHLDTARVRLNDAFDAAVEDADTELATRAAIAMVLASARGGDLASAHTWSRHAQAWLDRAGQPVELAFDLETAIADVYVSDSDHEQALAHARKAQALLFADEVSARAGRVENLLGLVRTSLAHYDEAAAHFERAIAIVTETLGPDHPNAADSLNNLGAVHLYRGDPSAAEGAFLQAYEMRAKMLGPEHPRTALSLMNLGITADALGDPEAALEKYAQAEAIYRRTLGTDHPQTAQVLSNQGATLYAMGRYQESASRHREAIDIYRMAHGLEHPRIAEELANLAVSLQQEHRFDEAIEAYETSLEVLAKTSGEEHPSYGETVLNLAMLVRRQGDLERSGSLVAQGHAILLRALGPDHPSVALAELHVAAIALERHDFTAAVAAASRAHDIGAPTRKHRGLARFYLAQGLHRLGQQSDRVVALAAEARADFEAVGPGATADLENLRDWQLEAGVRLPPRP